MTYTDLLLALDVAGIRLAAKLDIDAPAGAMTPDIWAALSEYKPTLLKELTAEKEVDSPASTGGGTTIPEPAKALVLSPATADDTFLKSQDEIRAEVAGWPEVWREYWWLLLREMDGGGFTTYEAERCAYQHTLARIVRGDPLPDAEVFKRFQRNPDQDFDRPNPMLAISTWSAEWRRKWHDRTKSLVDQGRDWRTSEIMAFFKIKAELEAGNPIMATDHM